MNLRKIPACQKRASLCLLLPALTLLHCPLVWSDIGAFSLVNPPSVEPSACIDTAPFDDDYGWNGTCSCWLDGAELEGFGHVVALNGNVMAIGSIESPQACIDSGTLSIYEQTESGWQFTADLQPSNNSQGDRFPGKVHIGEDFIVAGGKVRPNSSNGAGPGKITTFARAADGQWQQTHQIEHEFTPRSFLSAHPGLESAEYFANDENILVAKHGDNYFDRMLTTYTRANDNTWQEVSSFTPDHSTKIFDVSGSTLAIATESGNALVVYEWDGNNWQKQAEFPMTINHRQILASGSLDIQGDTILYSEGNGYEETGEQSGSNTFSFARNSSGSWVPTAINAIEPHTIEFSYAGGVFTPNLTAEVILSPTENSFLQMRDTWERNFYTFDSFRSTALPELFLFTQSGNQWRSSDSIAFTPDLNISNQIGYSAAFDGQNILLGTRDHNTVLIINAGVGPADENTDQNPITMGCDYSDADLYGGWGWNATINESCPPSDNFNDETSIAQCIDSDGDGYGWNGSETCTPATSSPTLNSGCDYSDANLYGGWGWNTETNQSCAPLEEPSDPAQAVQCIDTDGDGYGWNGVASCIP